MSRTIHKALVKFNGMLCLAQFGVTYPTTNPLKDRCPFCRGKAEEYKGWWECYDCGNAVLMEHMNRMNEVANKGVLQCLSRE